MNAKILQALIECSKECELGYQAWVSITKRKTTIDTKISRNAAKSSNGGEYYFWLTVWPGLGNTLARTFSSCDMDWEPDYEPTICGDSRDYNRICDEIVEECKMRGIPVEDQRQPTGGNSMK